MDHLETAVHHAWQRVRAAFDDAGHDLAARLARRRTPLLTCPPRAWCLAIRASDRRIRERDVHESPHEVVLHAALCRELCTPVRLPAPGLMLDEAAELLGTTPIGLRNARLDGTLRTRHIKLLAGRRGKTVPLVYTEQLLDPCAKRLARPDPGWLWTANFLCNRVPPDLYQPVQRVAHHVAHVGRHRYNEHRHPELDAVPPRSPSKRLPPPEPDNVWYKWSLTGGHFLGDDPTNWRKSPKDLGDRPPRWRPKKKYKRRPYVSRSAGSLHFNGYRWLCPACGKTCRTLYLPLPPINLLESADLPRLAKIIDIPRAAAVDGFACHKCHRVRFFTRVRLGESWNQLIAYLTAGLLYGREVERPSWFTTARRNPYKPRPGSPPPLRRDDARTRLLRGESLADIAAAMNITRGAVVAHANRIYKSERVRSQRELMKKHGVPLPPRLIPRTDRILSSLRAGDTPEQIAAELNLRVASVERYQRDLRRSGKLPRYRTKRDEIAALHTAGLDRHAIAARLRMTPQSVSTRLCELRATGRVARGRRAAVRHG